MNGCTVISLVQINPDGVCYCDTGSGQVRVESTKYYKEIKECENNSNFSSESFEFDELEALVLSIVYAKSIGLYEVDLEKALLEIKCYTDKMFKDEPKSLAEYILLK